MKRQDLTRRLAQLRGFPRPDARLEQVATPAEKASEMLWAALARGDLEARSVLDLGTGTGTLAIGAALLGASPVVGIDVDPLALEVAEANAEAQGVQVEWLRGRLPGLPPVQAQTVLMNPPFGAQTRHADRPFLAYALEILPVGGAIHLFANGESQTFIERWALAHAVQVEERSRSRWPLPATFAHHTERRGQVPVDRWVLRKENPDDIPRTRKAGPTRRSSRRR